MKQISFHCKFYPINSINLICGIQCMGKCIHSCIVKGIYTRKRIYAFFRYISLQHVERIYSRLVVKDGIYATDVIDWLINPIH